MSTALSHLRGELMGIMPAEVEVAYNIRWRILFKVGPCNIVSRPNGLDIRCINFELSLRVDRQEVPYFHLPEESIPSLYQVLEYWLYTVAYGIRSMAEGIAEILRKAESA